MQYLCACVCVSKWGTPIHAFLLFPWRHLVNENTSVFFGWVVPAFATFLSATRQGHSAGNRADTAWGLTQHGVQLKFLFGFPRRYTWCLLFSRLFEVQLPSGRKGPLQGYCFVYRIPGKHTCLVATLEESHGLIGGSST